MGLALSLMCMAAVAVGASRVEGPLPFVVTDVRVFDGERVIDHRSVLVQDGRISRVGDSKVAVPRGTAVIDGRGRTLLPGLIDAHVHLSDEADADLRQSLALGVTTVLDMFTASTRFERIKALRSADRPDLADVRTAGTGATAPGGHPSQMGGPPFPTISDAAEATAFVDARLAEGSDFLKIIHDDLATLGMSLPMLDRPTLTALVAAAHARGKPAVVHILTEAQARAAIEARADGLVHLFFGATVSPDFAHLAAASGTFVVPTLAVLYGSCGQPSGATIASDPLLRPYIRPALRAMMSSPLAPRKGARSCEGTTEAVRQLARRQVPILAGTDAPVPGQTYGATLHGELALLVSAGLTPVQALAAATSAPARAFRLADRGHIRPGLRADLVLVEGDPTTDILATRRIALVWKRGIAVERARYDE